jgi:adenine/guanine phosphoribosyltransferase-like PRPP-binding protein
MMTTETHYRKVGRRYVPVTAHERWDGMDQKVGTFLLRYAKKGGQSWEYNVAPDTAGFVAAAMIAREAMEAAMVEKAKMKPQNLKPRPYTKRELALIKKFREDMGDMFPCYWGETSTHDICQAGIDAVRSYRGEDV